MSKKASIVLFLPVVFGLLLVGCADTTPGVYAKVLTDLQSSELSSWRIALVIAAGVEWLLSLIMAAKLENKNIVAGEVVTALSTPFCWTVFGEWGYWLAAWIGGLGWGGLVFLAIGASITGLSVPGGSTLSLLVSAGFIFQDIELLKYVILPGVITSGIMSISLMIKAAKA